MSDRTVEINLDPTASASGEISPEEKELNDFIAQQLSRFGDKKVIAEIYNRGVVSDVLHVDLPPELVGQWVPNDPNAIYRAQALGYVIDNKYAVKRALHSKGDGASYVGDVVHMIAPRQIREAIDAVKKERYNRIHGKAGKQIEEKSFEKNQEKLASAGIGTINDSSAESVDSIEKIRDIIDPNRNST